MGELRKPMLQCLLDRTEPLRSRTTGTVVAYTRFSQSTFLHGPGEVDKAPPLAEEPITASGEGRDGFL